MLANRKVRGSRPGVNDGAAGYVDVKEQHFQLLSFGSRNGGRPGLQLAMQEVPAAPIQCVDWRVNKPLNMNERPGLTAPRPRISCVFLFHG
ncbi:hypothetical protein Ancab_010361 [Ancistrocladus abbreviatus]